MTEPAPANQTGITAVAITVIAVACCPGGPLLLALGASLAVGALIGIAAAVLLLIAACTALYLRHGPGDKRQGRLQ